MINDFTYDNMDEAYPDLINNLLQNGQIVSPRGKITRELMPACITIMNPRKRVIFSPVRHLNYGFYIGELLWILSKSNDVDFISYYNKNWSLFSDDGKKLNGAYGSRIFKYRSNINQFELAYKQLLQDKDTRQASIVLFDPYKDYKETKDKPCTNLLRFSIRNNKLNMFVVMRSNDIIFGTPYDIFNFTMLQEIMAGWLNIDVGVYNHIIDSFHIYSDKFELGNQIVKENNNKNIYNNIIDSRVNKKQFDKMIKKILLVEKATRTEKCDVDEIIEYINKNVNNEYWKSLIMFIVLYNIRKFHYKQNELNKIYPYITNEFKYFLNRYRELK